MDFELEVKLAIYHHFAETGESPSAAQIGEQVSATSGDVLEAYQRLRLQRVLVLEADGASIRMAPPFSGVPTQHVVTAGGLSYFANCAWDAFGIPAALHKPATIHSRCEQSMQPLHLEIGDLGPAHSTWLFHCQVPAAHWWDDIVFT
jgi:hypothetical protein